MGHPMWSNFSLGYLGESLQGGGRVGRHLAGGQHSHRPAEATSTLSYLSVPAATGSKPRVSIAFSKEEIRTSSKEKLGCYLPKYQGEFSDAVFVASSYLRLSQHKTAFSSKE